MQSVPRGASKVPPSESDCTAEGGLWLITQGVSIRGRRVCFVSSSGGVHLSPRTACFPYPLTPPAPSSPLSRYCHAAVLLAFTLPKGYEAKQQDVPPPPATALQLFSSPSPCPRATRPSNRTWTGCWAPPAPRRRSCTPRWTRWCSRRWRRRRRSRRGDGRQKKQ